MAKNPGARRLDDLRSLPLACAITIAITAGCSAGDDATSATLAQAEPLAGPPPAISEIEEESAEESPAERARDRGIGIVAFDHREGSDNGGGADTILVLRDTTRRTVIARFIMARDSAASWFVLESREPLNGNALELDDEVEGLPVASASADGRWAVVVHGHDRDGSPRTGWVKLTAGKVTFRRWPSVLRDRGLFFAEGVEPEFFGSARGRPVEFPLSPDVTSPGRTDYIMHPMQVRGDWMQVRVTSPADVCASPPAVRQTVVWIRFLADDGRPRVWFHTRGC